MEALPVTIHKSWFGYFVITLAGASVTGLVWAGMISLLMDSSVDPRLVFGLGVFLIVVTALITIIQLYVYSLSFITLNNDGIIVKNWVTLFVSKDESFEWVRVSRATVSKANIFSQILNYGTLSIETNGGTVQASIKMIPNVEVWQDMIAQMADNATPDVAA